MTLPILRIDRPRSYPPRVTAFTARFWKALDEGSLQTTRCEACERLTFPPKPVCPHCWSDRVGWTPLSGRGKLYSRTVVHAAPAVFRAEVPYSVGIVDLVENLRIATGLAGNAAQIGDDVEIVVLRYSDGPLFAAQFVGRTDGPAGDLTTRTAA